MSELKWIRFSEQRPPNNVRVLVLVRGEVHEGLIDSVLLMGNTEPTLFESLFKNDPRKEFSLQHTSWGDDPYWMPMPASKPKQKTYSVTGSGLLRDMKKQREEEVKESESFSERVSPITPTEAFVKKTKGIPDAVITVFNELISENLRGMSSVVLQEDVLVRLADNFGITSEDVHFNLWLDVEPLFEDAGWEVVYDKPGYGDCGGSEGGAKFIFEVRK
jgi:hypothetical protein